MRKTRVQDNKGVFVHRLALCESRDLGPGTNIWAFAHVMDGARIGAECNIGDHVFIEGGAWIGDRVTVKNGVMVWGGVRIEDDAFIGPGVLFTNDVLPRSRRMPNPTVASRYCADWLIETRICQGASIGAGAVILPGQTIGRYSLVAAGAVVTRDVEPHALVVGNPARVQGYVCACGAKLSAKGKQFICVCGLRYSRTTRGLVGL